MEKPIHPKPTGISKERTGDILSDYFKNLTDFTTLAPNQLKAKHAENSEIWLEKLENIDRRALFRCLRKYINEIKPECLKIARYRFIDDI